MNQRIDEFIKDDVRNGGNSNMRVGNHKLVRREYEGKKGIM